MAVVVIKKKKPKTPMAIAQRPVIKTTSKTNKSIKVDTEKASRQLVNEQRMKAEQQAAQEKRDMLNHQIVRVLCEKWPSLFTPETPVVPLKINIHLDIMTALPEYSQRAVKLTLAYYFRVTKEAYLMKLITGGSRYNLQGNPCEVVTAQAQEMAQKRLTKLTIRKQQKT